MILNNLKVKNEKKNRSFTQISGFAKSLHLAFWQENCGKKVGGRNRIVSIFFKV